MLLILMIKKLKIKAISDISTSEKNDDEDIMNN